MRHHKLLISAGLLVGCGTAAADTTITTSQSSDATQANSVTYITEDHMRVDTGTEGGYMLFDPATDTITIVQPAEESYMVIGKEQMQAMGQVMQQARARMEKMLAQMPPAQRERMRQMMGERFNALMGGGAKAKPEVVHTGEEKTVAGYSCEVVKIRAEGTLQGSYCLASIEELGIPEADAETLEEMMAFSRAMAAQFSKIAGSSLPTTMMTLDGVPIAGHATVFGITTDSTLKSVETGSVSADLFTVPEGYSQRSLPKMPMQ